jgi:hypothetical protein
MKFSVGKQRRSYIRVPTSELSHKSSEITRTSSGTITPTEACFEKMQTYRFWNINWLQKSKPYSYYSESKNFIRHSLIFEVVSSVHAETCINLVRYTK